MTIRLASLVPSLTELPGVAARAAALRAELDAELDVLYLIWRACSSSMARC